MGSRLPFPIILLLAVTLVPVVSVSWADAVRIPPTGSTNPQPWEIIANAPPIPLRARHIAAGGDTTCAVTTAGVVNCWGANDMSQLGDGTTTSKPWPTETQGLADALGIQPGWYHTCAFTADNRLQCWGSNSAGQLGDGTTIGRLMPQEVLNLSDGVRAVAAGWLHTCAITTLGAVRCWGYNAAGQLGDGSTVNRVIPVDVVGLASGIQTVVTGRYHSCALTYAGGVQCWGWNVLGQLGDGTLETRTVPAGVTGLISGVRAVTSGGDHTCALTGAGARCWGWNAYGQLGDGTYTSRATPVAPTGLNTEIEAISAGRAHTCALLANGHIECWGENTYGQLGDGTTTSRPTTAKVIGLPIPMLAISAGNDHTCALASDNGVWCWGANAGGSLGDGTSNWRATPVQVVQKPAFDCAGVTEIPQSECLALRALADHTDWLGWDAHAGWEQPTTPCSWYGVTCQDGHVTAISLQMNDLRGTIPAEIGNLPQMTDLNLAANRLSGSLPSELGQLTALQTLDLHNNQLSGPLTAALGNLVALRSLDLSGNQLSGPLPAELGDLANLVELNLAGNELNGAAPAELGRLTNLADLYLHGNHLVGPIPPELGLLVNLRHLRLNNNQLSGHIPRELGGLSKLEDLYLDDNDLSGAIPLELGNLTGIQARYGASPPNARFSPSRPEPDHGYLDVSSNHLSGSVPVELSKLYLAASIELGCNQLSGQFPPPGGEAMNLNAVAEYNMLAGADPHGYWDLTQTLPPTNLQASAVGQDILLTWTPIVYSGDGGFYEISYAMASGGPFIVHSATANKTVASYILSDVAQDAALYFRVRTFTPAHASAVCGQRNDLWSDYTPVVCVNCEGTGVIPRTFLPILLH